MGKINSHFIERWEPRYDEIASDQGEYLALLDLVSEEICNYQTIRLDTFKRIINWKSPRAKGKIKWNSYEMYQRAFRLILDADHSQKMSLFIDLPGIGAPISSVILHFIYPEIFPIYDFRTVEVLNAFGYLKSKTVSQSHYPEFQNAILRIRTELVHYNLRQIDRALFAYHKINSEKYKDIFKKKNEKCRSSQYTKSNETSSAAVKMITVDKANVSIPEIIKSICEELGAEGKIIKRKDIITRAKQYGINESSVLPADYCDNTKTGQWSRHSFLHSVEPGKYVLSRFKEKIKEL